MTKETKVIVYNPYSPDYKFCPEESENRIFSIFQTKDRGCKRVAFPKGTYDEISNNQDKYVDKTFDVIVQDMTGEEFESTVLCRKMAIPYAPEYGLSVVRKGDEDLFEEFDNMIKKYE